MSEAEPRIRLACAEYGFNMLPWEEAVGLVGFLGFEGLNLSLMDPTYSPIPPSHLRLDEVLADVSGSVRRIRAGVDAAGVELAHVHVLPPVEHTRFRLEGRAREESRDWYRRLYELVAALGAESLTIPAGSKSEVPEGEDPIAVAAAEFGWRVDAARELGIQISVEPDVGSIVDLPEDAVRLCEMVPAGRLTLDYSHFVCRGVDDREVDQLLPFAELLHGRGGSPGHLQSRIADNTIDFARLVRRLDELDFDGYIALEYVHLPRTEGFFEDLDGVDQLTEVVALRDLLETAIADLPRGGIAEQEGIDL